MHLLLRDSAYTDRLASFLRSLGQAAVVSGPDELELDAPASDTARQEMAIYLRVWQVLYPEAEVEIVNGL
jgi:hypothetical protein